MLRDEVAAAVLIGSLAVWGVLHVHVAMRLVRRHPRWRGVVALILPPLAPYWAARTGDRVWAAAWGVSLLLWGLARLLLPG